MRSLESFFPCAFSKELLPCVPLLWVFSMHFFAEVFSLRSFATTFSMRFSRSSIFLALFRKSFSVRSFAGNFPRLFPRIFCPKLLASNHSVLSFPGAFSVHSSWGVLFSGYFAGTFLCVLLKGLLPCAHSRGGAFPGVLSHELFPFAVSYWLLACAPLRGDSSMRSFSEVFSAHSSSGTFSVHSLAGKFSVSSSAGAFSVRCFAGVFALCFFMKASP